VRRRRLPEPFTFFVDECLGRHVVPDAVRGALLPLEQLVTRPQGTLDETWLEEAGEQWICLTKDHALRRRPGEIEAIRRVGAGIFLLGEASGAEQARRILAALPIVRRVARTHDLAFIARIQPDGRILVLYEGGDPLASPRLLRPKANER
jgi:PIN like domain